MSSHPEKFDQFDWMRAWLNDGLNTHAVAVLTVIFSHLRPDASSQAWRGWPSITTIAKQAGCSRKTAIKYVADVEAAGWIKKSGAPGQSTTYTATYPQVKKDRLTRADQCTQYTTPVYPVHHPSVPSTPPPVYPVHHPSVPGTPPQCTQYTTTSVSGASTGVSGASTGVPGTPEQHKNSIEQLKEPAGLRAPAREPESDSDDIEEIVALFEIENHPIGAKSARALKDHIERHQPSAIRYIEARLIDDEMGRRFSRTRSLLAALRQDAIHDGASVYAKRGHPDDPTPPVRQTQPRPKPGPSPEPYQPPSWWTDALEVLNERLTHTNFEHWIQPIRAESTPVGIRLWCPDEFAAIWVSENYDEMISNALGQKPIYGPLSDDMTAE